MTTLPDTKDLGALGTLEPDLLYVFVAGPGAGEGVAVALPRAGWLIVDGCTTQRQFPLNVLYRKYTRATDDTVRAVVLTHPHQDHAYGIADVIEALTPAVVGVAGVAGTTVAHEFEALGKRRDRRVTSNELRLGVVEQAVNAITDLDEARPGVVLRLHAGTSLPLGHPSVTALVQSPAPALLQKFFADLKKAADLVERANEVSTVIELSFGQTTVILGADLPRIESTAGKRKPRAVATGWDEVMARSPHLEAHHGLKLPHHASAGAFHSQLNAKAAHRRAWWVTPFNSSRLPRVADLGGLPRLLEHEPSLYLTALPASKRRQYPVEDPGVVRLDQLTPASAGTNSGVAFADNAVPIGPAHEAEPLEPVWVTAFDDAGRIRGRWRGAVALEVLPPSPPRKARLPTRKKKKTVKRRR